MLCDVLQETAEEELDYDADEVMELAPAPVATQVPLLYHCFSFDCILPGEGRVIQNSLVHSESNGTQCSAWKGNATLVLECLLIIDVTALAWHDVAVGDEPVLKSIMRCRLMQSKRRPPGKGGLRTAKGCAALRLRRQKSQREGRGSRLPLSHVINQQVAAGNWLRMARERDLQTSGEQAARQRSALSSSACTAGLAR